MALARAGSPGSADRAARDGGVGRPGRGHGQRPPAAVVAPHSPGQGRGATGAPFLSSGAGPSAVSPLLTSLSSSPGMTLRLGARGLQRRPQTRAGLVTVLPQGLPPPFYPNDLFQKNASGPSPRSGHKWRHHVTQGTNVTSHVGYSSQTPNDLLPCGEPP